MFWGVVERNYDLYYRGRAWLPAVPKKLIKRPALAAVARYPAKIRDERKSTGTLPDAQQILHELDSSEYILHAAHSPARPECDDS